MRSYGALCHYPHMSLNDAIYEITSTMLSKSAEMYLRLSMRQCIKGQGKLSFGL